MDLIKGLLVLFVIGFILMHKPMKSSDRGDKRKDGKGKFDSGKGGGGHR